MVKSDSGIKQGDTIKVTWLIPTSDAGIGGGWPARIQKGSYCAYLMFIKDEGKDYLPAAYTGSFVAVK